MDFTFLGKNMNGADFFGGNSSPATSSSPFGASASPDTPFFLTQAKKANTGISFQRPFSGGLQSPTGLDLFGGRSAEDGSDFLRQLQQPPSSAAPFRMAQAKGTGSSPPFSLTPTRRESISNSTSPTSPFADFGTGAALETLLTHPSPSFGASTPSGGPPKLVFGRHAEPSSDSAATTTKSASGTAEAAEADGMELTTPSTTSASAVKNVPENEITVADDAVFVVPEVPVQRPPPAVIRLTKVMDAARVERENEYKALQDNLIRVTQTLNEQKRKVSKISLEAAMLLIEQLTMFNTAEAKKFDDDVAECHAIYAKLMAGTNEAAA